MYLRKSAPRTCSHHPGVSSMPRQLGLAELVMLEGIRGPLQPALAPFCGVSVDSHRKKKDLYRTSHYCGMLPLAESICVGQHHCVGKYNI